MKNNEETVRPAVVLTKAEHKEVARYCLENDLKIGDFIKRSVMYCVKNDIVPEKSS
jgi:hypothetical protein